MKINPTSLTINQLFGSANEQYVIPTYQRRYSWHERQVWELIEDIDLIDESDTHLLGSIVCLASHHKAGVNQLELVDGQQRITTITIILECIRQRLQADEKLGDGLGPKNPQSSSQYCSSPPSSSPQAAQTDSGCRAGMARYQTPPK